MSDPLPRALELARASRESADPMLHSPADLWHASQIVPTYDRAPLYRHAMIEAGYIVATSTGKPYAICPECGWEAVSDA